MSRELLRRRKLVIATAAEPTVPPSSASAAARTPDVPTSIPITRAPIKPTALSSDRLTIGFRFPVHELLLLGAGQHAYRRLFGNAGRNIRKTPRHRFARSSTLNDGERRRDPATPSSAEVGDLRAAREDGHRRSRLPRDPARGTPRGQDRASRAARSRGFSGRARQRGRRDRAAGDSRSLRRSTPSVSDIGLWRCARRRGQRFAHALNAIGDFRNRLTGNDEAMIGEDENVRVLRQPFRNRMGKRQAWLAIRYERKRDVRMRPQAFAHKRLRHHVERRARSCSRNGYGRRPATG